MRRIVVVDFVIYWDLEVMGYYYCFVLLKYYVEYFFFGGGGRGSRFKIWGMIILEYLLYLYYCKVKSLLDK